MIESNVLTALSKKLKDGKDNVSQGLLFPRDRAGNIPVRSTMTFLVEVGYLAFAFNSYLRLHGFDVFSLIVENDRRGIGTVDFIAGSVTVGGTIEVLLWASVATTLRWMNIGRIALRRKDPNSLRHLIDWMTDLITTPLIAAVIIYSWRLLHITFGQRIDLSLENADVGVFAILGFLLGFFDSGTKTILIQIRDRTLGFARQTNQPAADEDDKGNYSACPSRLS